VKSIEDVSIVEHHLSAGVFSPHLNGDIRSNQSNPKARIAINVGKSAAIKRLSADIAPLRKCSFSKTAPAGFGALVMTVKPPQPLRTNGTGLSERDC